MFKFKTGAKHGINGKKKKMVRSSVAEPEPPEPYNFDPRRTGTVSLL
jgi:hypothetical protein